MREDEDIFVVYASMIGVIAFCTPTIIVSLQYFKYAESYNFEAFIEEASYILYMSLASIGVLFILLSVLFILRVSEVLKKYHQNKYATEVEWFWMFSALFVVMLLDWPFLKISFEMEDTSNLIPAIFVDLVIVFSGMNIFAIFAVREKTRKATAASEF
jgi:heme/copper-type cytochrome/quinol oxidase subunit 2